MATELWRLEEFQPGPLLGFIRNLRPDPAFAASRYVPDRTINDITFEYLKGVQERPVMAHVITWDSEAPIGGRPGIGERLTGELPPIKRKSRISEKEIIRKYNQPRAGTSDVRDAIEGVFDDLARHVRSIQARSEWLKMQALTEPKVIYNDGGIVIEFDYGLPDAQQVDLTTGKNAANQDIRGASWANGGLSGALGPVWSDTANSTPITDLMVIADYMEEKYGERPVKFLCDRKVLTWLWNSAQIKGWTYATNAPDRPMTPEEVSQTLTRYDLPQPEVYGVKVQQETASGALEEVRCMRQNRITFLPQRPVGEGLWGPTAESRVLLNTPYAQQAPGIVGGVYATDEPVAEWTKAAAVHFPTMPDIDKVFQMRVAT